jgi:hypothetical protein
LDRTETTETIAEEDIFVADDTWGSATRQAYLAANAWLEQVSEGDGTAS